nr:MAG TPA: C2H2 type zinc-finger protein [Caudoviricetes sp.]
MKIKPLYCCETCGKSYHTVREAVACENGHKMGNMRCICGHTLYVVKMVDGFEMLFLPQLWRANFHRP